VVAAERRGSEYAVLYEVDGRRAAAAGDRVFVSIGRAANVEGLGLERAGIEVDRQGVKVDDRLRTTNPRVYAAGDVCSPYKFTHAADAMARLVLANALFHGRGRASRLVIPWATYTDPEVAHVGLYEEEARARGHAVDTLTVPFHDVDRAVLEDDVEGFARVHVERGKDRILGATVVSRHASELIAEVTLAMTRRLGLAALGSAVHTYPTLGSVWQRLADQRRRGRLTPRVRSLFESYFRWLV
jgi:pyruvate/2-oxoglutarate dehydrogenase complex dihydrolipoamide dehydrogenase (E3) component